MQSEIKIGRSPRLRRHCMSIDNPRLGARLPLRPRPAFEKYALYISPSLALWPPSTTIAVAQEKKSL
jgi:hypothetical protein